MTYDEAFARLDRSAFRRRFRLTEPLRRYVAEKGMETIRRHAQDFVRDRLALAHPANDGRQTPMRGHPVFVAQHATATCCRGCLEKWHQIPRNRELTTKEVDYIVDLLMAWVKREL